VFDPFFSVRETLRIQSGYFGLRRNDAWIDEIMHHLDLTAKADANMRTLSGGMKRRVLVAQALVHRPPVIVLDEPTAGVDVGLRQGLWQFIRRLNRDGHTIVLTTHYLEEAEELCDRIAMLKAGKVVALDSTRNLLENFSGLVLKIRLDREALPDGLDAEVIASAGGRFALRLRRPLDAPERLAGERVDLQHVRRVIRLHPVQHLHVQRALVEARRRGVAPVQPEAPVVGLDVAGPDLLACEVERLQDADAGHDPHVLPVVEDTTGISSLNNLHGAVWAEDL